jgi:virginiamycin A acetyltransferase
MVRPNDRPFHEGTKPRRHHDRQRRLARLQALVLPGVTIRHGAAVAAAGVIAGDVDPYTVVAGNPAPVVRRRFDKENFTRAFAQHGSALPVNVVPEHARVIIAGEPAKLEKIAAQHGFLQA